MSEARGLVEASLVEVGVDATDPNLDLIEAGLLDSLGLVSLVAELEERIGAEIPFETLEIDDFRTIASITGVVEGRLGEASGARPTGSGKGGT